MASFISNTDLKLREKQVVVTVSVSTIPKWLAELIRQCTNCWLFKI